MKEVLAKTVHLPVTASIIRPVITSMVVALAIYVHLVGRAIAAARVGSILRVSAFKIKFYITFIRLKVLLSLYTVNKQSTNYQILLYTLLVFTIET